MVCGERRPDALIGGFYVRSDRVPLGELRIGRRQDRFPARSTRPGTRCGRACTRSTGRSRCAPASSCPAEPGGDLLQAGPMLIRDGVSLVEPGSDPEGFSAGERQFDSDITAGRYPRAALGVTPTDLIAVVCEGRADDEAGLDLAELAAAMADLGAVDAINLDGGGSASLVVGGELVNSPREQHGVGIPGGRSVPTALQLLLALEPQRVSACEGRASLDVVRTDPHKLLMGFYFYPQRRIGTRVRGDLGGACRAQRLRRQPAQPGRARTTTGWGPPRSSSRTPAVRTVDFTEAIASTRPDRLQRPPRHGPDARAPTRTARDAEDPVFASLDDARVRAPGRRRGPASSPPRAPPRPTCSTSTT